MTDELLREYIRAKLKLHTDMPDEESPESVRWFGKLIEQGWDLGEAECEDDEEEQIIN